MGWDVADVAEDVCNSESLTDSLTGMLNPGGRGRSRKREMWGPFRLGQEGSLATLGEDSPKRRAKSSSTSRAVPPTGGHLPKGTVDWEGDDGTSTTGPMPRTGEDGRGGGVGLGARHTFRGTRKVSSKTTRGVSLKGASETTLSTPTDKEVSEESIAASEKVSESLEYWSREVVLGSFWDIRAEEAEWESDFPTRSRGRPDRRARLRREDDPTAQTGFSCLRKSVVRYASEYGCLVGEEPPLGGLTGPARVPRCVFGETEAGRFREIVKCDSEGAGEQRSSTVDVERVALAGDKPSGGL